MTVRSQSNRLCILCRRYINICYITLLEVDQVHACACLSPSRSSVKRQCIWKTSWLPSPMFHRSQRFVKLWRGTLSYRGLTSSSGWERFPSLLHKRGIVFQQTSKRCALLLHSSALWKHFCSGRHAMFDFSAFTYRFYSHTVPVLSIFSVPDIVMRHRSICRRRTKSIVVFVLYLYLHDLGVDDWSTETVTPPGTPPGYVQLAHQRTMQFLSYGMIR